MTAPIVLDRGSQVLAQTRPADTSTHSAYSPPTDRAAIIDKIIIANSTGGALNASVFVDNTGSTFSQATAIRYAYSVPANGYHEVLFESGLEIPDAANIGVQSSSANGLTFTVLGRLRDAV